LDGFPENRNKSFNPQAISGVFTGNSACSEFQHARFKIELLPTMGSRKEPDWEEKLLGLVRS